MPKLTLSWVASKKTSYIQADCLIAKTGTARQWRVWRRAELGLLGPRSSLTTPVFSKDLNGYGENLLCSRLLKVKRIARQFLQTVKILRTLQPSRESMP